MQQPESFIVRVYRRESPSQVRGVVEIVRSGKRVGFATPEELWALIASGPRLLARKGPSPRCS
jgi:hypothetical protein